LQKNIIDKVENAREFFDIKDFPSNLFELIQKKNYIDDYKLLLFKEDIGKLSGFIGYGENNLTVICINYKRTIGHQNFTFAHELGHWFLHNGNSISDDDACLFYLDGIEKEANDFAAELLYPVRKEIEKSLGKKISEYFEKDFYIPNENLEEYQQLSYPYNILEQRIDKLIEKNKIGIATAESIKLRNKLIIE